jgi:hypothetical protein
MNERLMRYSLRVTYFAQHKNAKRILRVTESGGLFPQKGNTAY